MTILHFCVGCSTILFGWVWYRRARTSKLPNVLSITEWSFWSCYKKGQEFFFLWHFDLLSIWLIYFTALALFWLAGGSKDTLGSGAGELHVMFIFIHVMCCLSCMYKLLNNFRDLGIGIYLTCINNIIEMQ